MYDEERQLPQVTRDNGPVTLPADVLLIVPVRNIVMFPGAVTQVALTRDFSMRAAQEAVQHGYKLGIVLQKDPSVDTPGPDDLYKIGTTVTVVRYLRAPNGVHHLICQGEQRFRTLDYLSGLPFLAARFDLIPEQTTADTNVEARVALLKQKAIEAIELLPQVPPELAPALQNIESPGALADMVAGLIDIKPAEKQTILEALKVRDRLDRVIELLTHRVEVLKLSREIGEQTQGKLDERQREYVLREQLKTIKKELGEDDTQIRARRAAPSDRRRENARGGREAGVEGAAAPRRHAGSVDGAFDGADVPRLARRVAVVEERRRSHRHRERTPRSSTRTTTASRRSSGASSSTSRCASSMRRAAARSSASSARPASARRRSARASRAPWGSSSCARAWAACTTKPRSAAIGAPISARCPARSFKACARPGRTIPCSCSTRWTSSASASTATRRRRCSRCSIPSRTRRSPITISTCRST